MARSKKSKKTAKPSRAAAEPVLEEVDTGGAGIDEGLVFTAFFLLAGAVTLMYMILNTRYPVG